MKKIAIIDHSYHKKTKSSDFLRNILKNKYTIYNFYDDSWRGGKGISVERINSLNIDIIVYFQVITSYRKLKKINCKNIIWIPMYDSETERNRIDWLRYYILGVKIFCFSRNLYLKIKNIGFQCAYSQYYISPGQYENLKIDYDNNIIFFWQRTKEINWSHIKNIIRGNKIKKIIFKNDSDPGHNIILPDSKDIEEFNIEIVKGWVDSKKYVDLLSCCNIFIAPRLYEGIGMSFLEAMAMGMCVVAPDNPTMSEYITSEVNGYLYCPKKMLPIDLSIKESIGRKAKLDSVRGFNNWIGSLNSLINFIEIPRRSVAAFQRYSFLVFINIYDLLLSPLFFAKLFFKRLMKHRLYDSSPNNRHNLHL